MKKASIYLTALMCPLLCTAMELPSQELSSFQSNRQEIMVIDNGQEGREKYLAALTNWDKDPGCALDLLFQATALGDPQALKKLEDIRKLKTYKEPAKGKSQPDIGALLRKMEPTSKELYLAGMKAYGKIPNEALRCFFKAEQMGSKDAKKKLNEIRKSKDYTSYVQNTIITSIGDLLKAVDTQASGHDSESKQKALYDITTIMLDPNYLNPIPEPTIELYIVLKKINRGVDLYKQGKYVEARKCFNDVYNGKDVPAEFKVNTKILLAEMNMRGYGIDQPNYTTARQEFEEVCHNDSAPAEYKAHAQLCLVEMDIWGQGIEVADYTIARQGLHWIFNNNQASLEIKSKARHCLAEMNMLGLGIEAPDYKAAQQVFQEIAHNNELSTQLKEEARLLLAKAIILEQKANKRDDKKEIESIDQIDVEPIPQEQTGTIPDSLISQKHSKKHKTLLLPAKSKKEALIMPSTRSTGKERRSLQRRNTETNLIVNTQHKEQPPLLTRRVSSSDLKVEKKKKSEGFLLTQTDAKKALKKKKSHSNLKALAQDDDSECSFSESSSGLSPLQDGRRDKDLRKVKALLKDSNLVHPAGIKLTASIVRRALRELGAAGQNKISWNFEKDNNTKHDKIIAQQLGNQHNSLCIHLHGPWYENKDIINHFLTFTRLCDAEVDALMTAIETRKSQKRNSIKYEKLDKK